MKNLITLAASFLVLLPNLALAEGSEHCDSRGWCQCPGGVAASRCLRNYASCSEACGLSSGSASASPGSYSSLQQMQLGIAKQVGTSLGTAVGEVLFGNPQQDAARQAAAAQAAEQQRLAAEQRAAEATRQQELAKQRIFGLLKGAESAIPKHHCSLFPISMKRMTSGISIVGTKIHSMISRTAGQVPVLCARRITVLRRMTKLSRFSPSRKSLPKMNVRLTREG